MKITAILICMKFSNSRELYVWIRLYYHYYDVTMSKMASRITSLAIVYSSVYSGADQRTHRWPVNSPSKGPVMRKMFPFDDVIMMRIGNISWVSNGTQLIIFHCLLSITLQNIPATVSAIVTIWIDFGGLNMYGWQDLDVNSNCLHKIIHKKATITIHVIYRNCETFVDGFVIRWPKFLFGYGSGNFWTSHYSKNFRFRHNHYG